MRPQTHRLVGVSTGLFLRLGTRPGSSSALSDHWETGQHGTAEEKFYTKQVGQLYLHEYRR